MVGLVVSDFCVADEVVSGEGLVVVFLGMLLRSTDARRIVSLRERVVVGKPIYVLGWCAQSP